MPFKSNLGYYYERQNSKAKNDKMQNEQQKNEEETNVKTDKVML